MRRGERGAVLIEVLAAVTILGIAAISLLELVSAATRATADLRDREYVLADAERLLTAYTLLTRTELDQRLGARRIGAHALDVQRPERALYRIAVDDLVTVTYRPEPFDVPDAP